MVIDQEHKRIKEKILKETTPGELKEIKESLESTDSEEIKKVQDEIDKLGL